MQLLAIINKELRLLCRDIHGLLLLFVMPTIFIVIMSLAMKEDFDRRSGVQLAVLVDDLSNTVDSAAVLATIANNPQFQLDYLSNKADIDRPTAQQLVKNDRYRFMLTIQKNAFSEHQANQDQQQKLDNEQSQAVSILVAPAVSKDMQQMFVAVVREALLRERQQKMLAELIELSPELQQLNLQQASGIDDDSLVEIIHSYQADQQAAAPTSVQQNVPAWLVFAMFFVVVPLANTLINERQLGTLKRMRSLSVANWKLLAGKIIPYFIINQLQVVLMIIVGITLVPMLGGDQLSLGSSWLGLIVISSALSIAALGYGMLIAVISETTEQATTLGGAGNIILAALGGIMVPTFIMPAFMQSLAIVSPMSWGLEGFLDVFLRGGGLLQVWPEALSLLLFGVLTLSVAVSLLGRKQ